ncbi:MAG: cobalamin-binding protein [Anaerolineales bacterium]|nr:MAG: cobalamin-binding protein [Anaerolineales bacterium]
MSRKTRGDGSDGPVKLPKGDSAAGRPEKRTALIRRMAELKEQEVLAIVRERLSKGDDPLSIVAECQSGMRRVGERYERGQYYLAGLIMAGEILREVMELAQPLIEAQIRGDESGRVLLGTVQGDIHDIGKNVQGMLLSCHGFSVYDLGVDVPPATFLAQAREVKPDIIGLSGLLTSSHDTMRDTINLIRDGSVPELAAIPIIIGGSSINEQVCQYVGADYWITNSMECVRLCHRLLADRS